MEDRWRSRKMLEESVCLFKKRDCIVYIILHTQEINSNYKYLLTKRASQLNRIGAVRLFSLILTATRERASQCLTGRRLLRF